MKSRKNFLPKKRKNILHFCNITYVRYYYFVFENLTSTICLRRTIWAITEILGSETN